MDIYQLNFEFYNYHKCRKEFDKLEFDIIVNNIVDQITPRHLN